MALVSLRIVLATEWRISGPMVATYPGPRDSAPKDIVFAPAIDSNNGKYLMIVGQQGPIGRQDGIYHGQIISMIRGINTSLVRFAQSGNNIGRIGDRLPH